MWACPANSFVPDHSPNIARRCASCEQQVSAASDLGAALLEPEVPSDKPHHKPRGILETLKQRTQNVVPLCDEEGRPIDLSPDDPLFWQTKLEDSSPEVRHAAVQELQRDPALLAKHTAHLIQLVRDESWFVRRIAVSALGRLELDSPQVGTSPLLPLSTATPSASADGVLAESLFLPTLEDAHAEVRAAALAALGRLSPGTHVEGARAAAPLLSDTSPAVRAAAIAYLGGLGPAELTSYAEAIAPLLDDQSGDVRVAAIVALASLEASAMAPYSETIIGLEDDPDPDVRYAASRATKEPKYQRARALSQSKVYLDVSVTPPRVGKRMALDVAADWTEPTSDSDQRDLDA